MKVIFLDHDGVICLSNNWGGRSKKWEKYLRDNPDLKGSSFSQRPWNVRFDNFDPKAVKVLNKILEDTGAEIVVSSDWKLHATLEELGLVYEDQGIIKKPIDVTPNMKDFDPECAGLFSWKGWLEQARAIEIQKWLEDHPEVTHWVSVDDLNMSTDPDRRGDSDWGLTNFVLTPRSYEGIKQSGVKDRIKNFLK